MDKHLNPDFGGLVRFFKGLLPLLSDDQHVVLRSTVYPGTTMEIKKLFEESDLKTSVTFLPGAYSPGKSPAGVAISASTCWSF